MTTSRIDPRAGWVRPDTLPRGPGGRALCRECSVEVPVGRRTFCGDWCVKTWKVRTSPTFAARAVFERDRGVCATCGFDARYVASVLDDLRQTADMTYTAPGSVADGLLRLAVAWLLRAGFGSKWDRGQLEAESWPSWQACRSFASHAVLWEADHIVPVVEGGGACGLDGYRTLCRPCHVRETAALRRRRARQATLPGTT